MKHTLSPTLLIVDDEYTFRRFLSDSLKEPRYRIITASSGSECLSELKNTKPDIILTDMVLPDSSGLKILELAKQLSPGTDVIMVTGYANMNAVIKALKMGASDYITKPVNIEELKILIKKYIDKKKNPFLNHIKNITPGRFTQLKLKKGNAVLISLGGRKKRGIASYPQHAKSYKKLIDYSDKAMYIGKETTRNAVHTTDDLKKL